jgi:hypothetical protein
VKDRDTAPVRARRDDAELNAGAGDRAAQIAVEDDDLHAVYVHGDPCGARMARLHRRRLWGGALAGLAARGGDSGKDRS